MPKGLIPLMLGSGSTEGIGSRSRSSLVLPPRTPTRLSPTTSVNMAHKRNASDITPMIRSSKPPVRATKRQSQQTPASLPVLPYTSAEWKKAIAEIKRFYVTRRHRACSARCNEILTNTKDISKVEPAYLIYLNFYAATSLEMCARPLQPASYRTSLLQQARGHYEKAVSLIQTAEEAATSLSRSSSPASSVPSLHSPSSSVSSRAWTPDTGVMTPTSPVPRKSSLQQEPRSEERRKPKKKKVSFELPKDKEQWPFGLPEPIVRPDSPTLGFDDEYFAAGALRQDLPELPVKRWSRQDLDTERIEAVTTSPPSMPSISEREELSPASSPSSDSDSFDGYYFARYEDSDSDSGRPVSRYCETLSSLRRQVACHMSSLDELLESDQQVLLQDQPGTPLPHDATNAMSAGLSRMSISSYSRQRSSSGTSSSSSGSSGDEDEARIHDLKARIERLRLSGWKRKRFDASRYEELCEQVMSELGSQ